MLGISSALDLSLIDKRICVEHILVATSLEQQIKQDLIRNQLIEESVEAFVLEQLQRGIGFLQMVHQAHDWRAKDEIAEADFFVLRAELSDHLRQQLEIALL